MLTYHQWDYEKQICFSVFQIQTFKWAIRSYKILEHFKSVSHISADPIFITVITVLADASNRHSGDFMMTSSNGNIFRIFRLCVGNSPVTGEFPSQRPVMWNFDVFFHLRLNKQLSKQSWGWWFEMLSCPLWRLCNANLKLQKCWKAWDSSSEFTNCSEILMGAT